MLRAGGLLLASSCRLWMFEGHQHTENCVSWQVPLEGNLSPLTYHRTIQEGTSAVAVLAELMVSQCLSDTKQSDVTWQTCCNTEKQLRPNMTSLRRSCPTVPV